MNTLEELARQFVIANEKLRRVENLEDVPQSRLDTLYQNVESRYQAMRSEVLEKPTKGK